MKIAEKQKEGVHIIELSGELDFHSSPEVRERLQKVVDDKIERILIDLKKVSYIDSSGLATFVEAFQKTQRYKAKMVLAGLVPQVKSVFEIAKLDSIFSFASSEEEGSQQLCS